MILRNPKSRFKLNIKRKDRVLEIGGGHNPHPKAHVVVDKFIDENTHRGGDLKLLPGQTFIQADGEDLPFKDNEFDYVICCHVLEHVDNPERFIAEMTRVAKRGYVETPSLMGEYLAPKYSHRWTILEIDGKMVFKEKADLNIPEEKLNFGDIFLYFLNSQSLAYKLFFRTYPNVFTVKLEWENELDFVVEPKEEKYQKYFNSPWTLEMIQKQFPKKSIIRDFGELVSAFGSLFVSYVKALIKGKTHQRLKQIGLGEVQK